MFRCPSGVSELLVAAAFEVSGEAFVLTADIGFVIIVFLLICGYAWNKFDLGVA